MKISANFIKALFAAVGKAVTSLTKAGSTSKNFTAIEILDAPPAECKSHTEFVLAKQEQDNHDSPGSKLTSTNSPSPPHTIAAILPREGLEKGACSNLHALVANHPRGASATPLERTKHISRDVHLVRPCGHQFTTPKHNKENCRLAIHQQECIDGPHACWSVLARPYPLMSPGGYRD